MHSTALNSSDNLHSYPPDNHHSSDDVYWRGGDVSLDVVEEVSVAAGLVEDVEVFCRWRTLEFRYRTRRRPSDACTAPLALPTNETNSGQI